VRLEVLWIKQKTILNSSGNPTEKKQESPTNPKLPKVIPPRTQAEKDRGCSGQGPKPRRGIHCLGLTLKTHQAIKQDQGDAWQSTAAESVTRQQLESFRQPAIVKIL